VDIHPPMRQRRKWWKQKFFCYALIVRV
jgi:hypothetical protein